MPSLDIVYFAQYTMLYSELLTLFKKIISLVYWLFGSFFQFV